MSSTAATKAEAPRKITARFVVNSIIDLLGFALASAAAIIGLYLLHTGLAALGWYDTPWSTVTAGVAGIYAAYIIFRAVMDRPIIR